MPPSLREWLPEDHLAWFVIDAVAAMDLAAFYAAYRADGQGRRGARSGDDGGAVALRATRSGSARRGGSSGAASRTSRSRVICGQPGARSHDDRAVPSAPRGRAGRAVRRGAGAVREAGLVAVGVIAVDGTKVHANASAARDARLRADRARDPRRGRRGRRRRGRALRRARAATSCRRSWRPRRAGAGGCARPSAGSMSSAPRRRGRSRASRPERLQEAKRRLEEELAGRVPRQRRL